MKFFALPLMLLVLHNFQSCSKTKLQKESSMTDQNSEVSFQIGDIKYQAQTYLPKNVDSNTPTVLIIHEWWGANEYVQMRAKKLNEQGIAAITVDLYGNNKVVENPKDAQALATPFYQEPQKAIDLIKLYLEKVKESKLVNEKNIYLAGYCFGGTQALNYVRAINDSSIKGVFSFHGGLTDGLKNSLKKINAPIYVFNGKADPMVPAKDVAAFKAEMKKKGAKLMIYNYEGALHAFTNPQATAVGKKYNLPVAYDETADKDSWEQMIKAIKK
jgi:dienelactone hydrolase